MTIYVQFIYVYPQGLNDISGGGFHSGSRVHQDLSHICQTTSISDVLGWGGGLDEMFCPFHLILFGFRLGLYTRLRAKKYFKYLCKALNFLRNYRSLY